MSELKGNIVSMEMITNAGYAFKGKGSMIKVTKASLTVVKGRKMNGLYIVEGVLAQLLASVVARNGLSCADLWHNRLAYLSESACVC